MKLIAAALLFAASTGPLAQINPETLQAPPSRRWFSLDETDAGFVAGGNLEGTAWAFHVRGEDRKRLDPTTFAVGGAVINVKVVPRSALPKTSTNVLAAHKRWEQDHQQRNAKSPIQFAEHPFCNASKVAHEQWTARVPSDPRGIVQAVVTFEVGDYVLMVSAPFESEKRLQAVARAMADVCGTIQVKKI